MCKVKKLEIEELIDKVKRTNSISKEDALNNGFLSLSTAFFSLKNKCKSPLIMAVVIYVLFIAKFLFDVHFPS